MKRSRLFLLTLFITLLPLAAVAVFYGRMPETVVTHWNASGVPDGWMPKWAMLILPAALALLHTICHFATKYGDPRTEHLPLVVQKFVYWIIPAVSVFAIGITLATAMEIEVSVIFWTLLLVGVMMIVAGNYMPKCRQNGIIGVRLPTTLKDPENWKFTHRVTGPAWVLCGLALVFAAFLEWLWLSAAALVLIILVPLAASLLYWAGHR